VLFPSISSGKQNKGKVIIIGAGLAGLTAAKHLQSYGWEVEILEARDRIGGRIHTNRDWGFPIELGANWIHEGGHPENPLLKMAEQNGVQHQATHYSSANVYKHNGDKVSALGLALGYYRLDKRLQHSAKAAGSYASLAHFLKASIPYSELSPAQAAIFKGPIWEGIRTSIGEDLEQADADFYLNQMLENGKYKDYLVTSGYDHFAEQQAATLQVKKHHIAQAIDTRQRRVAVHSNHGVHEADYAIVTVPLGVLKSGAIAFNPGLSVAKRRAIEQIGYGSFNKVFLKFEKKFWGQDKHFYVFERALQKEHGLFVNLHKYTGKPVLVGLPSGEAARVVEQKSEAELKAEWTSFFRTYFPGKDIEIARLRLTRWGADNFSKGAYSFAGRGANKASFEALSMPEGRIHFAGEATNARHHGNVHSAVISGIREADRINSYTAR
jgi:monoamine oxidase